MRERTGNYGSIYITLGASSHIDEERDRHDYYATKPETIKLLLQEETFSPAIWECARGEGHLSKVLPEHGFEVINASIICRRYGEIKPIDFLTEEFEDFERNIITNPPYKFVLESVERVSEGVQHGRKVELGKVDLQDKEKIQASVLSGGEKQRLAIARAIFKDAQIIFADEPTAFLDMDNRKKVVDLLKLCVGKGGMVITFTHDESLAQECDLIVDMDNIKNYINVLKSVLECERV